MAVFHGTKHDDTFNESSDTTSDTFDLFKGGNDTVIAGSGDDTFKMGAALNAADRLDGGGGKDVVFLHGDYSAGVTFDDDTIQNIEVLRLGKGFNYNLTLADGNVAARDTLTINASKLGAGNSLTFDGSAESDGHFAIYGGAGNDTLTGGARADIFHLEAGGNDTAHGGGGNDTFDLGGAFTRNDAIDGGTGNDTVMLEGMGDDAISFTATTMIGVETLVLGAGHFYTLTTDDATVAAGATLTVDATALGAGDPLIFNGSHESDGNFVFAFGGGFTATDTITGGAGDDTLSFDGTYASLALSSTKLASLESLAFTGAQAYTGVSVTGDIAGGSTLTIDASAASSLSIDLSAATSAAYAITGSGGADTFKFGTTFLASDTIDGGAGNDTLALSGGDDIVFGATTLTSIETLKLTGGSFDITTNDGNVASGKTLTVDATALTTAQALDFNGAAEQDGNFVFKFGANFIAGDTITGGAGNDTLSLNGNYASLALSDTAITSVETLDLLGGNTSYHLALTGDIAGGHALTLDGSASRFLTLDLTAATSASYAITAAVSNTTIKFGSNFSSADTIAGNGIGALLQLNGDYSSGVTISGANITHTGEIDLLGNNSYTISVVGDFNSGHINDISATPGAANTDFIDLTQGTAASYEVISNGTGLMTVKFAGNFNSNEFIGGGNTTVELDGDYSAGLTFATRAAGSGSHIDTLSNVTTLKLDDGFSYNLVMDEDNNGHAMTVDATALTAGHTLTFDGTNDPSGLTFKFGAGYSVADSVTGGAGSDTLILNATAGTINATFTATTMTNVETLTLIAGNNGFSITTNDANVAAGATLTVDASAVTSITDDFKFDGGAETDGHFAIIGPAGVHTSVTITGGALSDTFTVGNDSIPFNQINGGGGDDILTFSAPTFAAVQFDGGTGNDTLALAGGGTVNFVTSSSTLTSVETLKFDDNNWNFTEADGNVASGATLIVDGSALSNSHSLTFNGALETDGKFAITGGAGNDTLKGGAGADTITGGLGADTLTGGGGEDVFRFTAANQSSSTTYDTVTDFAAGTDAFDLTSTVLHIAALSGTVNSANFDANLQALGASHLQTATVLTVTGGDLNGHVFLVVDGDGNNTYTAGQDYVIDITGYTGTLTTGDFI